MNDKLAYLAKSVDVVIKILIIKGKFFKIQVQALKFLNTKEEIYAKIQNFISKNLYTFGLSNAIDLPYIRIFLQF
ncbi:hypothetical protein BpHYR1_012438 [Brachionus plicatilis]|uniref:Uncharacterized protein n=1 Tax=Brachionus plicatilis TaxID=10195 RepID=A0A3M7SW24_BRAPC|nr:hypothetical protein BpHYR1_012438 [Brachionus plicatilis]